MLDEDATARALALDPAWCVRLRARWVALIDIAVFGGLSAGELGTLGKLRRKCLDLGERLRSLSAGRDWIPHPRERLKNALASALGVREALTEVLRLAALVQRGADRDTLRTALDALARELAPLAALETQWANLLDAQVGADEPPP